MSDTDLWVKLIGLGGVGSPVARYSSLYFASPAMNRDVWLTFIDGDRFEAANDRVFFRTLTNKAESVRDELLPYVSDSRLTLLAIASYVTPENIEKLIREGDLVLLCVDNHRTRKLVSDHVGTLRNAALISAGNDPVGPDSSGRSRRGTYGNCQVYVRRDGADATPPLGRYHPEIDDPIDSLPGEASCVELAKSVPQILFTNLMTASCALNALYRLVSGGQPLAEVAFDMYDACMRPVQLGAHASHAAQMI